MRSRFRIQDMDNPGHRRKNLQRKTEKGVGTVVSSQQKVAASSY